MKDHRMPFLGIGAASIVLVLTIVSYQCLQHLRFPVQMGIIH